MELILNIDDYNVLNDILADMRHELSEQNEKMNYHLQCIKQDDIYIQLFINSEPDDFKLFSPRNAEDVHRSEIEKTTSDKESHQREYDVSSNNVNELKEKIEKIERILEHKDDNLALLNLLEKDRQRIAGELHDTSLQNLAHLVHKIELSSLYIDQDILKAKLELSVVNKILKETIGEIRNTIFDLRPMTFDDLGLKAAIERLLSCVNENKKYNIEQKIEDVSCETSDLILLSIYRVVQECMNNIQKHSLAQNIWIKCRQKENRYIIDIRDNGKGFDVAEIPANKHFGLSLMQERVELLKGRMTLSSEINKGTKIHVEIPLN